MSLLDNKQIRPISVESKSILHSRDSDPLVTVAKKRNKVEVQVLAPLNFYYC